MDAVKQPLVSVIMPAYNTELYIGEAIDSIINQTYPYFELLICDDGSTDKTHEIAEAYVARDTRIQVFRNKKNIGNLKTTNFLFSNCSGKYIAIHDADDVCIPSKIQLQVNELEKDLELGLVGTNYMLTDENLNPISCSRLPLSDTDIKKIMQKEVPPILYGSVMVRRALLESVGDFRPIFDRKGYADIDWIFRLCEITKVKNLNQITYFYRQQGNPNRYVKDLVGRHGLELIFEAHRQRLHGQIDFLENGDMSAIRYFLSDHYRKLGDRCVWNRNLKGAKAYYRKSIMIRPFNLHSIKNLIKLQLTILE